MKTKKRYLLLGAIALTGAMTFISVACKNNNDGNKKSAPENSSVSVTEAPSKNSIKESSEDSSTTSSSKKSSSWKDSGLNMDIYDPSDDEIDESTRDMLQDILEELLGGNQNSTSP